MIAVLTRMVGIIFGLSMLAMSASGLEIKKDTYDIYLGDVDGDGDADYYFAQKPWTLILHGDIATPLVLSGTRNFAVYNNSGVYSAPQNLTLAAAVLANKIATGILRPAVLNSDYFVLNPTSTKYTLLLRGADASAPGLLITSYSSVDLPGSQDIVTLSANSYRGISDRTISLQVIDVNGDGKNDIFLIGNDTSEYAYLADNNAVPNRYFEVTPAITRPTTDATHVGTTAAQFQVDESGAAIYNVSINVPDGVASVKPQIGLAYSSGSANGIAGMGWSISGLSAISRCRQTLAQDNNPLPIAWNASDRFCLDGQRLILVSGTYGAAGSTYKTEIDNVLEVKAIGGSTGHPNYFEVKAKDGTVGTYGATTTSKLVGATTGNLTLTWAINRFEDRMHNAIEYVYEGDAASGQRIKDIYYAYSSISTSTREATGAQARVEFVYKERPDVSSVYVAGFKFAQQKLLDKIKVYNTSTSQVTELLRSYNLSYMNPTVVANRYDNSLISRLISLQECRGTACYAPLTFEWGGGTHLAFVAGQSVTNAAKAYIGNPLFGDYDGDGVADFAYIYYNTSGQKYAKIKYSNQTGEGLLYLGTSNHVKISNLDYNLDGRMDLAYFKDNKWYVSLSVPDQVKKWKLDFAAVNAIALPADINAAWLDVAFADLNSDGAADVIYGDKYRLLERNSEPVTSNKAYSFLTSRTFQFDYNQMPQMVAGVTPIDLGTNAPYYENGCDPVAHAGIKILTENMADFNGDGRIDFLIKANSTVICRSTNGPDQDIGAVFAGVYAVTTAGAFDNLSLDVWNMVLPRIGQTVGEPTPEKIQTVDVNSDGLTDIVIESWNGNDLSLKLRMNNGRRVLNEAYEWKKLIAYKKDRSPQISDINGDGLADIVTTNKTMSVMFGKYAKDQNGNLLTDLTGNWLITSTDATVKFQSNYNDASQFMMDVSGDGVLDNILLRESSATVSYGAMSLSAASIPCTISYYYDWNTGEEREECVGGIDNPSEAVPSTQQQNAIYQFDSGAGNITKINYGTLAKSGRYTTLDVDPTVTTTVTPGWCGENAYDEYECFDDVTNYHVDASKFYSRINGGWELPAGSVTLSANNIKKDKPVLEINGSLPIVTSVESTAPKAGSLPGNVDQNAMNKVDYYYAEAKIQASGRGFLGYAQLKTIDAQTGIVTVNNYRQDFPFVGHLLSATVYSDSSANPKTLSYVLNKWNFKSKSGDGGATKYYLPYIDDSLEKSYDPDNSTNSVLQTVVTDNTYDDFGNLTYAVTTTSGKKADGITATSLIQTITNEYGAAGVADFNNLYGNLTKSTVVTQRDSEPGNTKISNFVYEQSGVKRGLLSSSIIQGGPTTTYDYDEFGNQKTVSITALNSLGASETHNTINTYSADGRYLVSKRNDLDQFTSITTRNEYGSVVAGIAGKDAVTIPSGTTHYDVMGTEYMKKNPDGSWARTESRWCSSTISCPIGAVYRKLSRVSGGGESVDYFDKLGRTIRSSKRSFGGAWSNVDTEYDSLGQVKHQSVPFLSANSEDGQASSWTTTNYDYLGRPIDVKEPNAALSRWEYSGSSITALNTLNQKKIETKNGLGQLVKVEDEQGGVIEYEYDVYGNLLKASTTAKNINNQTQSISVRMCYDNLGRKTAMLDPDKGGTRAVAGDATIACSSVAYQRAGWWTYKYNGFGELIEQADPKGQRTQMYYDKLGRMIGRVDILANNSIEGFTQWFYEKGVNNQLTGVNGKLTAVVMNTASGLTFAQITNAINNNLATCSETSLSCHKTVYEFDILNRATNTTTYYPGNATPYTTSVVYDLFGRTYKQYDPLHEKLTQNGTALASGVQTSFNDYGYVKNVFDIATGSLLSSVESMNARGQVTTEIRGNGVTTQNTYDDLTGQLTNQNAGIGSVWSVQNITYKWNSIGNLQYRKNNSPLIGGTGNKNKQESFCYDNLNRLTKTVAGQAVINPDCNSSDVTYDGFGNIKSKLGVGNYEYSGVNAGSHAVTKAGTAIYTYDANGNALTAGDRTLDYTSYDMAAKVSKSASYYSQFKYGHDRARWQRTDLKNGVTTITTYIGNIERIETSDVSSNRIVEWKRNVNGALFTYKTNLANQVQSTDKRFIYADHLGSMDVITDAAGIIRHSLSFDAWGARRGGENWSDWQGLSEVDRQTAIKNALSIAGFERPITNRGFTGHETADDMGLIHMNGRIYDARIGRFLQADIFIDGVKNTQGYNRYSYIHNNPLNAIDPSGFSVWAKFRDKILKPVIAIVLTIVTYGAASAWAAGAYSATCAVACTTAAGVVGGVVGGAAAGFVGGVSMAAFSGVSGSAMLKAGFKGAASGALFGGVAGYYGGSWSLGRVAATGIAGGLSSEINGQSFQEGFKLGVALSLVAWGFNKMTARTDELKMRSCNQPGAAKCVIDKHGVRTDGTRGVLEGTNTEKGNWFTEGGMAAEGSGEHLYDKYRWSNGVAKFVNHTSKTHDWFNSDLSKIFGFKGYDNLTGMWVGGSELYQTSFQFYSFMGMLPAGIYTGAALLEPYQYVYYSTIQNK